VFSSSLDESEDEMEVSESESEARGCGGPAAAATFEGELVFKDVATLDSSFSPEEESDSDEELEELDEATLLFRFLVRFRCVRGFAAGGMCRSDCCPFWTGRRQICPKICPITKRYCQRITQNGRSFVKTLC